MKLLTFLGEHGPRLGIRLEQGVLDVAEALKNMKGYEEGSVPTHMDQVIKGGRRRFSLCKNLSMIFRALPKMSLIC